MLFRSVRRITDAVHDLRVAVRRAQSASRAMNGFIPAKWPAKVSTALKPLRKSCDLVRDLDVLRDWLKTQPLAHLATAGLLDVLQREHDRSFADLLLTLKDTDSLKKTGQLIDYLEKQENPGEMGQAYRVRDVAAPVLLTRAAAITVFQDVLGGSGDRETIDAALHKLRIAGKEFRYALEMLAPALSEESRQLREHFSLFQDSLGGLHDRIRFEELLDDLSRRSNLPDEVFAGLRNELNGQRMALWQAFSDQWQSMTPQWFNRQVLKSVTEQRRTKT